MTEPAESLLLSACFGALIGLIRQWEVQQEGVAAGGEFAGLRTFSLVALLGCVSAFLADVRAPAAFPVALALVGGLLGWSQVWRQSPAQTGYATPVAVLLTFCVGAMVFWQERGAAVLLAALTLLLLGLKKPIHQWTQRFSVADVRTTLQFVAITGVILPLVPNRSFGPYQAINAWSTWLMVVLISGLGLLGYVLVRLLGPRAGITLSGLVGGLASSTATTLAFSRRSREDPARSDSYSLAVVLACNVMLARVAVVTVALSPALALALVLPLVAMAVPGLAFGVWMWLGHRPPPDTVEAPPIKNPLNLGTAVKFALIYAVVKLLVKAASEAGLSEGVVAVSAVAGLTDVDAIAISLAGAARDGSVATPLASTAVVVGCLSNTLVKAGIAAWLGSPALRRRVAGVLGTTAFLGLAALAWNAWR